MHNSFVGPLFFYLNNRGACSYKMIIALIYWSLCISIGTAAKVSDVTLRPSDLCLGNSELTSIPGGCLTMLTGRKSEGLVRSGGSNV